LDILRVGDAGEGELTFDVKGKNFGPDWRDQSELVSVHMTKEGRKKAGLLSSNLGKAFDDFTYMIDKAIDREELEDIRRMIRDAFELTPARKKSLLKHWNKRYNLTSEKP
jgi:hypothetical protein